MIAKKDYSNWTKEELIKELEKFKKQKKYGIVWEDKPEQVALMCKEKLPILTEDKGKEIKTDKNKSTNVLIEGDNYHALSVLNYTHKGKIDVIYI
ncbi:MAG: site-specific DNA-methyltransferase, partial [Candidatus Pacearchaeota archaeon]